MKPLKLVAANDTFGALNKTIELLQGNLALFITPPEINGLMPEVHGLPDEVHDDVALIVESSGSTGKPKRIELGSQALISSAEASAKHLGGSGQWLLALPINFIAGMNVLVRSVLAETQPVMMNTQLPFTAEAFARSALLMTGEKRFTSLVPAQLKKLAQLAEVDSDLHRVLRSFDAILIGGQAPDWDLVSRLRSEGIKIVVSYGMTETCGGCVYDGTPLEGVGIRVSSGVISISGPMLANGYSPWFETSDLGEFEYGNLKVLGRADRVIISGGLKVSLESIEAEALKIPGVEAVAAAGVSSEWGQSVGLVYVGSPEVSFDSLGKLSRAAKVAKVVRVANLPALPSGKPDLQAIKKLLDG